MSEYKPNLKMGNQARICTIQPQVDLIILVRLVVSTVLIQLLWATVQSKSLLENLVLVTGNITALQFQRLLTLPAPAQNVALSLFLAHILKSKMKININKLHAIIHFPEVQCIVQCIKRMPGKKKAIAMVVTEERRWQTENMAE